MSDLENLSGAFDEQEYLEKRFEKDWAEFIASHEKEFKRIAESVQSVTATQ